MRQPLRVMTFDLVASQTNTKLSAVTGMPKNARLVFITCDDTTVSTRVRVHVGTGLNTVILDVGTDSTGGVTNAAILSAHGMPITWGTGATQSLYYTSTAAAGATVTVLTDNY